MLVVEKLWESSWKALFSSGKGKIRWFEYFLTKIQFVQLIAHEEDGKSNKFSSYLLRKFAENL